MRVRPFKQVDVFTATPYLGNPLAVVLDGGGLSDEQMQQFARWTNLSETTFLLPPTDAGADYRVRIFTPGGELPFAGHPTLGSCHAWLQAGGQPKQADLVVQQCQVGLVRIRRDGARQAFAAPPMRRSMPDTAMLAPVLRALGLDPARVKAAQLLDNGPVWLGLLLDSPDTVLQLEPDHSALKATGVKVGVVAPRQTSSASGLLIARGNREARAFDGPSDAAGAEEDHPDFEVRAFAAPVGVPEDPVTGSLNASLAQWLIAEGLAPQRYVAAQGSCLERAGRVHITRDDTGQVWVGGHSVTCIDGQVTL
jgi:PhzF family phenazine biosynthesis protein